MGNQITRDEERPECLPPNAEGIPAWMKELKRYVPWRYEKRGDNWIKPPMNGASSTDPATWMTFEDAMAYVDRGDADGVAIASGDGLLILDFDDCVKRGKLAPFVQDAMLRFNSYAEMSPSGSGVHLFLKVDPDFDPKIGNAKAEGCGKVEVFPRNHFCSVTGLRLGKMVEVASVNGELEEWLEPLRRQRTAKRQRTTTVTTTGTDDEIWAKVSTEPEAAKLILGDTSSYNDNSAADSALAFKLAAYTHDPEQLRRLMERSALKRDKWNEERPGGDWLGVYVIAEAIAKVPLRGGEEAHYEQRPNGMYEKGIRRGHPVEHRMSTFWARLIAVNSEEWGDGRLPNVTMTLLCGVGDKTVEVTLTPEDLEHTSWVSKYLAPRFPTADILPGFSGREFRAAILQTSPEDQILRRVVYCRIGWFKDGGEYVYVTRSGAIGIKGLDTTVATSLAVNYQHYSLPAPRLESVAAVFDLLDFRSRAVTMPLLGAMFVSVLGHSRLTINVIGLTQSGKTATVCDLFMRLFGIGHSSDDPTTWDGTPNALVELLAGCAYAPYVLDDLVPGGDERDLNQIRQKTDTVVGAQGNGQGRARLNRDGTPKPQPILTGLLIITSESWVGRQSRTARTVQVPCGREDMDVKKYQAVLAKSHLLPEAMAAFIQWVAPRLNELREYIETRDKEFQQLERGKGAERQRRYDRSMGWLVGGFEIFTRFAFEVGTIDDARRKQLNAEAEKVIVEVIEQQERVEASARPHDLFRDSLRVAFATGKAYLTIVKQPETGLDQKLVGNCFDKAELIGWVDGENVYLLPKPARDAAVESAANRGTGIPDVAGLGNALKAAKLLTKLDGTQTAPKVTIPGHGRQRVWCLELASILDPEVEQ
jgi:hypothetical protein